MVARMACRNGDLDAYGDGILRKSVTYNRNQQQYRVDLPQGTDVSVFII